VGLVEGKVSLVTGGGSGIGRACAMLFASEGARVVVVDMAVDTGEETVAEINDGGGDALFVRCDIADASSVEAMVATTIDVYGRLDCALNNAGIEGPKFPVADYSLEDWNRMLDTNLTGTFLCMKYEIPAMLAVGGGAIVNTSSVGGLVGFASMAAYGASKFGVNAVTKCAALEYATMGVRVNSVCPGIIRTPMVDRFLRENPELESSLLARTPMGRLGRPKEIAEAVVWLCSDRSSFVTGQTIAVDGAYTA
jgi:NAD(P)-dependent dehydrogenase (short-subunit alcohol dehydrogenase family)